MRVFLEHFFYALTMAIVLLIPIFGITLMIGMLI